MDLVGCVEIPREDMVLIPALDSEMMTLELCYDSCMTAGIRESSMALEVRRLSYKSLSSNYTLPKYTWVHMRTSGYT